MKKILFVALIALCGISFGFGAKFSEECLDCIAKEENAVNCVGDCSPAGNRLSGGGIANVQKPEEEKIIPNYKLQK